MKRLALFISGGGSTAAAILTAVKKKELAVRPVLIVASRKNIVGIERILNLGFKEIKVIDPKKFKNPAFFADRLLSVCYKLHVDLIGQYGWLPKTPREFINKYHGRIINQHPGPLDPPNHDFGGQGMYGRRVHAAVIYFRRITGHDFWTEATSHLVSEEFDKGAVIGRKRITVGLNETVETLQERVLAVEHQLQIDVLKKFTGGKIKKLERLSPLINKNEIKILNQAKEIARLFYPHG